MPGAVPEGKSARPSAEELQAMEAVEQLSLQKCQAEGLSQAQADCILGAKTVAELSQVGECEAIRNQRRGWLIFPR